MYEEELVTDEGEESTPALDAAPPWVLTVKEFSSWEAEERRRAEEILLVDRFLESSEDTGGGVDKISTIEFLAELGVAGTGCGAVDEPESWDRAFFNVDDESVDIGWEEFSDIVYVCICVF